jgi:DNA-binding NarL/FixJ family response regulator
VNQKSPGSKRPVAHRDGSTGYAALTNRERDVLRRVVCGDSNAAIARRLHVREQTIKNHISVLMQKLHVTNRVQLAVLAACQRPELLN